MYTLIHKDWRVNLCDKIRHSTLLRFACVGGSGFVVDSCVFLIVLSLCSMPVFPARIIAFICSATTTWLGNRIFTFKQRQGLLFIQWRNFFMSAGISAIPNFMVFSLMLSLFGNAGYMPFIALVCGVVAGMFSNYFLCTKWVFASGKV